jgi:hypothetical protein
MIMHQVFHTAYARFAISFSINSACLLWILLVLTPQSIRADEIIMTTGEKFSSEKVWEENGSIRFNMHGLIVSVDKSEVAHIIRNQASPQPAPESTVPTRPAPLQESANKDATPIIKPLEAPRHAANAPSYREPKRLKKPDKSMQPHQISGTGLVGIRWHLTPSDFPGLKKLDTEPLYGGIDKYYRPDEKMRLGTAALAGKVYGFWRDHLYTITMWTEGPPAYERLKKAVFDHYGRGRKNSNGLERYVWTDPTTDRMLEFDSKLDVGLFWMRSRMLDKKIKQLYPE